MKDASDCSFASSRRHFAYDRYSGLLDLTALGKGEDYDALPDTYVIFITEHDVLKEGKAIYHVERMIDGQRPFADGAHILYVNGAYQGESPIGRLMSDFRCTDADDIRDPLLQSRAKYFKETAEGPRACACCWNR